MVKPSSQGLGQQDVASLAWPLSTHCHQVITGQLNIANSLQGITRRQQEGELAGGRVVVATHFYSPATIATGHLAAVGSVQAVQWRWVGWAVGREWRLDTSYFHTFGCHRGAPEICVVAAAAVVGCVKMGCAWPPTFPRCPPTAAIPTECPKHHCNSPQPRWWENVKMGCTWPNSKSE